jgi:hypothetical protein
LDSLSLVMTNLKLRLMPKLWTEAMQNL